jgi:threonine synthase
VVCTLTGHGLKDPGTAVDTNLDVEPVAPTLTAVRDALGW